MWKTTLLKWNARLETRSDRPGTRRGRVVRRLRRKVHRLVRKLIASDGLCLTGVDGMRMYLRADTAAFQEYVVRSFEPYTVEMFRRTLRPGATVVDVGAQFGYFSLVAARGVGPRGRVFAFEPVPANLELLRRNIEMNGLSAVVEVVQNAVSDRGGPVDMFVFAASDSHSIYRHPRASVREVIAVTCVTLDEFLEGRPVDLIKMDIEGHEPRALAGMERTIERSPGLVLFTEFNPSYLCAAGIEPEEFLARLQGLGFSMQLIDESAQRLRPVTPEDIARRDPSWYANLYCARGPAGRRS